MEYTREVNYFPVELLLSLRKRRGPVLRGRVGSGRYVYLLSAEANELVFAHDEWFSVREAMKGLIPVDGETSVVVSDGEDHARRRRLIRPALAPRSTEGYLAAMTESALEAMENLPSNVAVDAYPVFRQAIRRSTVRSLFGPILAEDADRLGEVLQPLLDLVDRLPQSVEIHRRLRTPVWRRAKTAREVLEAHIDRWIEESRSRGPGAFGILGLLVHGRDGDHSGLSHEEIRDQAITLIAAGYETTSAAMGWAVYCLARHQQWQERVLEEARSVVRNPSIAAQQDQVPALLAVISETLRLYPPATITARRVEQPFTVHGQRVEAGEMVVLSPYVVQRDEDLYPSARTFDPSRWIDAPAPRRGAYIPFGGGVHRCAGSHMATTELVVMISHLVASGPFRASGVAPRARAFAAMRPSQVTITREASWPIIRPEP